MIMIIIYYTVYMIFTLYYCLVLITRICVSFFSEIKLAVKLLLNSAKHKTVSNCI